VRIVGPGRAGSSLAAALAERGWTVAPQLGRRDDPTHAADGVDLCVISTPDDAIEETARRITPGDAVVAHLSGSLGIGILEPHPRRAAMHPLASLPDSTTGAATLLKGVWWAVEGDDLAKRVVDDLDGRVIEPTNRAAYHAAACIAANHVVALMAQVERIAEKAGIPNDAFYDLAEQALANARARGARHALTGPATRGDTATIQRHLDALDPAERPLYEAVSAACR
jgi:predicted short-subunit dehydrogenase-like oxidoreductase (DUF2520 family)